MCGEHLPLISSHSWPQGSSPHVRGAPATYAPDAANYGIIPACAGSTCIRQSASSRGWGSSPHVRGARPYIWGNDGTFGIIPACAGSTPWSAPIARHIGDHPRMCGEHLPWFW